MIASRAGMAGQSSSYFPYVKLVIVILYIRQSPIIGRRLTMELNWPLHNVLSLLGPRPRVRRAAPTSPPTVGVISQFVALRATDRW